MISIKNDDVIISCDICGKKHTFSNQINRSRDCMFNELRNIFGWVVTVIENIEFIKRETIINDCGQFINADYKSRFVCDDCKKPHHMISDLFLRLLDSIWLMVRG